MKLLFRLTMSIDDDAVSLVIENATIYMPFAELADIEREIERLEKEKKRLILEIETVNKKLLNNNFICKAPEQVIAEERAKFDKYTSMLTQVKDRIGQLTK